LDHIYDIPTKWNTTRCENIIIFIGGPNKHVIGSGIIEALKSGLLKIAKESNCWVITSGIDSDVSDVVGKMIPDNPEEHGLSFIGMTPARYIEFGENIAGQKTTQKVFLDKAYTNLVLLANYDGDEEIIDFNEQYQKYIQEIFIKSDEIFCVPRVLIIVEGGLETLRTANIAINARKHVLVIEVVLINSSFILYHKFTEIFNTRTQMDVQIYLLKQ
jgi:hypothetical protein